MQKHNNARAFGAGLAGTVVMTALMLMGPLMGMPEMNIGKMLAGFTGVPIALGWVMHLMIGEILAFIYVYVCSTRLPGTPLLRGAIFGLIPWLFAQVAVNPMMGAGIFAINTPIPIMMAMESLMGHLVYGAVVGAVYGQKQTAHGSILAQA